MSNENILSVTEVTRYIKRQFENDDVLQNVWIRGELSNFKHHNRGHMYFTIKDEQARMQAVMFAGNNRFLKFKPEDGMKVLIRGEITVYEAYGQYQMYAREMQPDGVGSLYMAYEQLKEKLEIEGLFAPHLKKPLPNYAMRIGIATSPTGAAIRDIITTIKRRFPIANITLLPVLVQGEGAAPSIVKAIRQANEVDMFDVLIIGRGGGSIEELWAFNEEAVARAIYHSAIPIISAVGHETDFTIADFVADIRAATPTAAAELAVPELKELVKAIDLQKLRLRRALMEKIDREKQRLNRLQKSYAFRYPQQLVHQKEQELDRLYDRLEREMRRLLDKRTEQVNQLTKDIMRNHPEAKVVEARQQSIFLREQLLRNMKWLLKEKQNKFQNQVQTLEVLSPLRMMERGYSLAFNDRDQLVKSITDVTKNDEVKIRVMDGTVKCQVLDTKEETLLKGG
ncbi:exodeoxyribonuclease VII large subunit [Alkalihalobacterium elongatum]|uniref:exodeoxyribonuclease VII large subunit n=1 Tax=Alkalihalobacterium elongatum TaxID=2675466 RepID=UPI001C1F20D0|nr:exodeoxyribonuclease VII large subunit [Alkalihalobacterium elongatum]